MRHECRTATISGLTRALASVLFIRIIVAV